LFADGEDVADAVEHRCQRVSGRHLGLIRDARYARRPFEDEPGDEWELGHGEREDVLPCSSCTTLGSGGARIAPEALSERGRRRIYRLHAAPRGRVGYISHHAETPNVPRRAVVPFKPLLTG
jgi:hypothetical protein